MKSITRICIDSICDGDVRVEVCALKKEFLNSPIEEDSLDIWEDAELTHLSTDFLKALFGVKRICTGQVFLVKEEEDGSVFIKDFTGEARKLSKHLYNKALNK
jgi:hypothetical protein